MPATYQVYLDGQPLTGVASWGDLETIHGWPGDCLEMSWSMTTKYKAHSSVFRRDAAVVATLAGFPVWGGLLQEPEWNGREARVTARGFYRVGENYPALDGALAATTNPTTAITAQQARGLPWRIDPSIPNTDLATDPTDTSIAGLLDQWVEQLGPWHWGVSPTGLVYMAPDAGAATGIVPIGGPAPTPDYQVPVGAGELSYADEFFSHIILAYISATTGLPARVMYPTAGDPVTPYEREWGHNDWRRDITDLGSIADVDAATLAQNIYLRSKMRPAWSNGLQLLPGELFTRGGGRADFTRVRGNQTVRVHGVRDPITNRQYVDFTIGKVTRKQGQKDIAIDPVGMVASSPDDIYQQLLEEAWAAIGQSAPVT